MFLKRGGGELELRYSPDQPRAPAGSPDGGQWTSGGGFSGGGSGGARDDARRRDVEGQVQTALSANPRVASDVDGATTLAQARGRGLGETPAQLAKESISAERAAQAIARVQEIDPDWRRPESLIDPENIEHRIARNESDAKEADQRYADLLRTRIGHNNPPEAPQPERRPPQSTLDEFYPLGISSPELDRIDALSRDPQSLGRMRWDEAATVLRLEKETGRSLKRSDTPGADFIDDFRRTWDAIGSNANDKHFNYEAFIARLKTKLRNRAADRFVVDLTNLGTENAAQVLQFIWGLALEQQAHITIIR